MGQDLIELRLTHGGTYASGGVSAGEAGMAREAHESHFSRRKETAGLRVLFCHIHTSIRGGPSVSSRPWCGGGSLLCSTHLYRDRAAAADYPA